MPQQQVLPSEGARTSFQQYSQSNNTPSSSTHRFPHPIQRQLDALTKLELAVQNGNTVLGESNGPMTAIVQQNDAIRNNMKTLEKMIENLRYTAEEQDRPSDTQAILDRLDYHVEQLKHLQLAHRKANLSAKRNMERMAVQERSELLKGSVDERQLRMRKMHDEGTLAKASSELTRSLQQAVEMMSTEVGRSAEVNKAFEESTRVMSQTVGEYHAFSSILQTSRQLVTKLQRRDWTDRLLLMFGLVVFSLTVLSILRRRLWIWVPGWRLVTGQCGEDEWFCF
ncbi:Sec20-domain-containing protein [Phlyctochytrium arcticum]|nr:Sec20-domain-containing protein [Phlyctochytrium arcticum]